jgi:hypothetical protein
MSGALITIAIAALVAFSCISLLVRLHRRHTPEKVDKVFQSETDPALELSPFDRLVAVQERYGFRISDEYADHVDTVKPDYDFCQSNGLTELARMTAGFLNSDIDELETACALAQCNARIEGINVALNSDHLTVDFAVNSPYDVSAFGSFLLFIRLCPQNETTSCFTRCWLLTLSGKDPVVFHGTLPLPPSLSLSGSVTDDVGDLRPDALSIPVIFCDIYLGTRRLYRHEITPDVAAIYRHIMKSIR